MVDDKALESLQLFFFRVSLVREQVGEFLACPVCRSPLKFEGKRGTGRFLRGYFTCNLSHVFQVKQEIGLFKDAKMSAHEFEWKINVADQSKYDEIRKQYDSYLREDQKCAMQKTKDRLVNYVVESCADPNCAVLDVATGMGTFILDLAEGCSRDALLVGTDIDERPLRGALNRARKASVYDRLSFIVTDAKHLCFGKGSLLTVSSYFGFDNVPETSLAFKETARVLGDGGRLFFSSLWLKENSDSIRLAEKHNVCQIASEERLNKALERAGLVRDFVEEIYSGVWPHNPMDLLPVEGDQYSHVIVHARKTRG